jgi:hypothetical protein
MSNGIWVFHIQKQKYQSACWYQGERVCAVACKAFATMLLEVLAMSGGIFGSWAQLHQLHVHT